MDRLLALAAETNADLAIANDPDADRCALAVPAGDGSWRALRGDELGVLLADHLIRRGIPGTYATTIVSSQLLGRLCAARGVPLAVLGALSAQWRTFAPRFGRAPGRARARSDRA